MNTPLILTFIGPVGVGKTTQMRLLSNYFESKNRKTVRTYIRSTHGICYLLLKLFKLIGISNKRVGIDGSVIYSPSKTFHKRITPLWILSEIISIIGKFFLRVYLPYQLGYNILIEEGLHMSIEHYKLFRPHFFGVEPRQPPLLDVLLRWITSRRHLNIVLDAGEQEIANRRKSRTFRSYESEKFVELQRKAISTLGGLDLLYIDTSDKSISSVHKIILDHIAG